jgi:antitoxin component YwqK of YwqJK toxin-antitoxin module
MRAGKKHGLWIQKSPGDSWGSGLLESIYREDVREGPYRYWHPDGFLSEQGTFLAGAKDGDVEKFAPDGFRIGVARHRAGKLDGMFRAYRRDGSIEEREYRDGKPWSGRHDLSVDGTVLRRATYANGVLVGAYEKNDYDGRPQLRATYADDGVLHGRYSVHHESGAVKLEGEYARGERVGLWTWRRVDGSIAAEAESADNAAPRWQLVTMDRESVETVEAANDEQLDRWVALADAWAMLGQPHRYWSEVERAVDAFAESDRARVVAWLAARIDEREPPPRRTTGGLGWIEHVVNRDDDPRVGLVDGISLDHHAWTEAQLARIVRRASAFRELCLDEVHVEPGVEALLAPGVAWPRLEVLTICGCGPFGGLVNTLAEAEWTGALVTLLLEDEEEGIAAHDAAALIASPHLTGLRELSLCSFGAGDSFVRAIASAPMLDRLERLELYDAEGLDVVLAAIAARATPALREVSLRGYGETVSDSTMFALADSEKRPALERLELESMHVGKRARTQIANARPAIVVRTSADPQPNHQRLANAQT